MSLYYDALNIIENKSNQGGTLKSRIYVHSEAKDNGKSKTILRCPPAQVYALITETRKWAGMLTDVVEASGLLMVERKLSPKLALFLVHDLLLSKNGVAASARHPLRLLIEKHKARLRAEFTKVRVKKGYATIDDFRIAVNGGAVDATEKKNIIGGSDGGGGTGDDSCESPKRQGHPRWVRVNALKSTLEEQFETTFTGYERKESLEDVVSAPSNGRIIYLDTTVPDLVALPPNTNISALPAYKNGKLIIQDKASCFPALLLQPEKYHGEVIDACAAPGNKTTHLAAQMSGGLYIEDRPRPTAKDGISSRRLGKVTREIFAVERDASRTETLRKMISRAGADDYVTVWGKTDFLKIDPHDARFAGTRGILLDPSCSGSGIVGRDEEVGMKFPGGDGTHLSSQPPLSRISHQKRKRDRCRDPSNKTAQKALPPDPNASKEEQPSSTNSPSKDRLAALSAFQLSILRHAMTFPAARRIVYSTCSVHTAENEDVVRRALASLECREGGWRLLKREEQVDGLRRWERRGVRSAVRQVGEGVQRWDEDERDGGEDEAEGENERGEEEIVNACIRCEKYDGQGTMGFFVVGFVRDGEGMVDAGAEGVGEVVGFDENGCEDGRSPMRRDVGSIEDEEEWIGFSDGSF